MQDFVALDFETANRHRASACEMSLVAFKDGKPVKVFSTLLKPPEEFGFFENTWIHGITEQQCKKAPQLSEVLDELQEFIDGNPAVCHNSAFDFSVLRKTLDALQTPYPAIRYGCTYRISKSAFCDEPSIVSFALPKLCWHLGIPFTETHRAEADAKACGLVAVALLERSNCETLEEVAQLFGVSLGEVGPDVDDRCRGPGSKTHAKVLDCEQKQAIVAACIKALGVEKLDPGGDFQGKSVVLTGELQSMTRKEAETLLEAVGAKVKSSVSSKTDFLIEGKQDPSKVKADGVSGKHRKCMELKASGSKIEVLDERMFFENLCD